MRLAVISSGTNSCRLLVVRRESRGLEVEHQDIRGTRLGEGLARTGELSADAMDRTLAAIVEFNALARLTDRAALIGTAALRKARNASAFGLSVKEKTGLDLHVLSGEEEARASFAGAMWSLDRAGVDRSGGACVVDVGGGSTEFAFGPSKNAPIRAVSIALGAVALTESYLAGDPPKSGEVTACRTAIRLALAAVKLTLEREELFVAVGGTADTAARMLQAYDAIGPGIARIERADLADLTELTSALPLAERRRLRGLPAQRADIFPAGLMLLDEIAVALGREGMLVTESDLLLGYLSTMG
jgi:exopolyphosphatase / guanosine-5'-triphosphate,3'-diphosphate pyrophosphatase